jgi:hypothetical protein
MAQTRKCTAADTDRKQWITVCRRTLIALETRNIEQRAKHWTSIVNAKYRDTLSRLSLSNAIDISEKHSFRFTVCPSSMSRHLRFIAEWKGLSERQIQTAPRTYGEYESKSRNWLNGRRAPNYASTLFPEMITASEIFAAAQSRRLFPKDATRSKQLCRVLVLGCLSAMCSARISLNDHSKKANLCPENVVKHCKSKVVVIFQRYHRGADNADPNFPKTLRDAARYFEVFCTFSVSLRR